MNQGAACAVVALLAILAVSAGCGDSTGPGPAQFRLALVSPDGMQPSLFVRDFDGVGRSRIRFDGVADDVPGNVPPFVLPVRDASIRALGPLRWSADGTRLAAVVTVAFQSQVIVMNGDGPSGAGGRVHVRNGVENQPSRLTT